jgi:hypothetical protein
LEQDRRVAAATAALHVARGREPAIAPRLHRTPAAV